MDNFTFKHRGVAFHQRIYSGAYVGALVLVSGGLIACIGDSPEAETAAAAAIRILVRADTGGGLQ